MPYVPPNSREACAGYQVNCDSLAGFCAYSDGVRAFIGTLCDERWVVSFDWPEWQEEAEWLVASRERLTDADAETIRRLLTLHVRKDRFCVGHLAEMLEDGHLLALLRRLRAIRDEDCL